MRARLGAMPELRTWQYLADAADVDVLIARMRASGLGHWVETLPRSPDVAAIEEALFDGLRRWVGRLVRLLPERWSDLDQWLRRGVELAAARRFEDADVRDLRVDTERRTAAADRAETRRRLVPDPGAPPEAATLVVWLKDFERHCPALGGREGYVVRRLLRCVGKHLKTLARLRDRAAAGESLDLGVQWRLRDRLADELRALLGGEPFHAGFVLVYALLEILHYEKCRALLIAVSRRWSVTQVLGGGT